MRSQSVCVRSDRNDVHNGVENAELMVSKYSSFRLKIFAASIILSRRNVVTETENSENDRLPTAVPPLFP